MHFLGIEKEFFFNIAWHEFEIQKSFAILVFFSFFVEKKITGGNMTDSEEAPCFAYEIEAPALSSISEALKTNTALEKLYLGNISILFFFCQKKLFILQKNKTSKF